MKVVTTLTLHRPPETRLARNGESYASVTCREVSADGEPLWVRVFAFGAEYKALSGLAQGDLIHVAGQLKLGTYASRDGEIRVSTTIFASAITPLDVAARLPGGLPELGWSGDGDD